VLRCWENLVLAMLGEQFMVGDEICGAVVSIRSVTFQTVFRIRNQIRIRMFSASRILIH
jgi:hypothetical protein